MTRSPASHSPNAGRGVRSALDGIDADVGIEHVLPLKHSLHAIPVRGSEAPPAGQSRSSLNGLVAPEVPEMGLQLAERGAESGELSPCGPYDQLFSPPFDLDVTPTLSKASAFGIRTAWAVPILKQPSPSGSVGCTGLPLSEGLHGHLGPPLGRDSIFARPFSRSNRPIRESISPSGDGAAPPASTGRYRRRLNGGTVHRCCRATSEGESRHFISFS